VAIKILSVKRASAVASRDASVGIEAAHSGVQPRKTEQRIELRGSLADQLPDFARRGQQNVDLDGLASFDVLQHRGLERAKLSRHGVAILAALLDRTADSCADRRRLAHHLQAKPVDQSIVENPVDS